MYFTVRIITASIALFIVINGIHGFKPNLHINLSSLGNSGPLTIGVYRVIFIDSIFPLPFDSDDYIVIDFIYGSKLDLLNFVEYFTIKIRENIWNVTNKMVRIKGICEKIVYEFKIDEVLNEVFNCKLSIHGYKSRLYFIESNDQTAICVHHNMSISFFKNFIAYWLIFDPKMLILNNDINYNNFLKKCNSIRSNAYLYLGSGILLFIFIVQFTFWYLSKEETLSKLFRRKRKFNQIIMVRPVGIDG